MNGTDIGCLNNQPFANDETGGYVKSNDCLYMVKEGLPRPSFQKLPSLSCERLLQHFLALQIAGNDLSTCVEVSRQGNEATVVSCDGYASCPE